VWIGLSREGYGIHGTADPSKVSKTESHGCIRLTNWDALSLASATMKGTIVDFSGDDEANRTTGQQARRKKSRAAETTYARVACQPTVNASCPSLHRALGVAGAVVPAPERPTPLLIPDH